MDYARSQPRHRTQAKSTRPDVINIQSQHAARLKDRKAKMENDFVPEYTVRKPVMEDLPELMKMAKAMHSEGAMMPMSEARSREMIVSAIQNDTIVDGKHIRNNICAGVIGPVGKPEAVICMILTRYWYSNYDHLEEVLNYVSPEHRKSTRAKYLIEYAKMCSREIGIPLLIGVLSQERTEAKVRLYQRQLGKPVGAWFLYNGVLGGHG